MHLYLRYFWKFAWWKGNRFVQGVPIEIYDVVYSSRIQGVTVQKGKESFTKLLFTGLKYLLTHLEAETRHGLSTFLKKIVIYPLQIPVAKWSEEKKYNVSIKNSTIFFTFFSVRNTFSKLFPTPLGLFGALFFASVSSGYSSCSLVLSGYCTI